MHFRLTCNQRAVLIEELVARRRLQCTGMASNMTTELKKAGVHEEIVRSMRDHGAEIERRPVEVFNVDDAFRFVLNTTISLKECIEAISATAKAAEDCFSGAESGAALLAQLMEYFGADHLATMARLGDHVAAGEPVPEPEPEAEIGTAGATRRWQQIARRRASQRWAALLQRTGGECHGVQAHLGPVAWAAFKRHAKQRYQPRFVSRFVPAGPDPALECAAGLTPLTCGAMKSRCQFRARYRLLFL